jgi:hypothetical protein
MIAARRIDVPTLRAAWWTLRATRRAARSDDPDAKLTLPRVPPVSPHAERGVLAVLRRRSDTCLTQSRVRQAWLAAHGVKRDLIIGVKAPGDGFKAHAWLEGDPPSSHAGFAELARRPPSVT